MPDIAFLGLAIETDQLVKAHEELSKLPAAAGAAEQSTRKLTEAAKALGESADKSAAAARRMTQYDDAAMAIHRSAQAAKEADNAFKSATASASSMVRASAANAAQFAQGPSHPLFGALTKGAKEATGELQKTAAATAEYAAIQARAAEATKKVAEQVKTLSNLSARDRVMLGYQLNDIFTQVASGQNLFMIAAQQGPQITQIFGGLRATLAAIPKAWLIGGAAALGVGIFGAILKSINEMNDAIEEQRRRLGTLLGGRDQAVAAYRDITKFASATGIAVSEATEKFVVFARATQSLGVTRQGILSVADVVEKLTQISGASEAEGGAARNAVAGMLKDSTVSAEELRTVLANVPQIAEQIAAGLGVSVTQLKLMAVEGTLTNQMVFEALAKRSAAVNDEFSRMPKSLARTFQSLADDLGEVGLRLASTVPLVVQFRMGIEGAAKAARDLNEATRPKSPAERMEAAGGPSVYTDRSNRIFRGAANPGAYYQAQYELGLQENADTFAQMQAQAKAISEGLTKAVSIAEKIDPVDAKLRETVKQIEVVEKALSDLLGGKVSGLSAAETQRQVEKLRETLRLLGLQAAATQTETEKALQKIGEVADQQARGLTEGQRRYEDRVTALQRGGATPDQAATIASTEQLQSAEDLIGALERQARAEELKTAAMRGGTQAMIEAAVNAAVLDFALKNVAASTEQLEVIWDVLMDRFTTATRSIEQNKAAQSMIGASRGLAEELKGIEAAMKVLEQGAFAMRRAEAAAKTSQSGGLELKVFDARQKLVDAGKINDLKLETDLTKQLAAAIGDANKQRQIQLEFDIKKAQREAAPSSAAAIEQAMRENAAANERKRVMEEGLQVTEQSGDGSAKLARTTADLNRMLDEGAISYETYSRAMRQATMDAQDQERAYRGAAGGLDGFLAGFEQGISDMSRANSEFETGRAVVSALGDTFDALAGRSNKTFLQIATDFGLMILKMEFAAQASNIWNGFAGKGPTNQGLLSGLLQNLFGAGGGGGAVSNVLPGTGVNYADALAGGLIPIAKGAAFSHGNIIPFAAGGVVTRPTLFPMADGGTGLMGEAGEEAIMPLRRGPGGRLGVEVAVPESRGNGDAVYNITNVFKTPDADSFRRSKRQLSRQVRQMYGVR